MNDPIQSLQQALEVSPNNVPLRRHIAQLLVAAGKVQEAEAEFRLALQYEPGNADCKLGLAQIYLSQGKLGNSLVLIEDVFGAGDAPAFAYLLYARTQCRAGQLPQATSAYMQAVRMDPACADKDLEEALQFVRAQSPPPLPSVRPELKPAFQVGDHAQAARPHDESYDSESDDGGADEDSEFKPELVATKFTDVGGMESVKDEVRLKIILPFTNHDLYAAYGKRSGGGILLYGPPGCGKTHIARATAGEINANFVAVGLHDILDMWIGNSEKRLHALFQTARANKPCVLFFDEVDALAASRSDMKHSAGRHVINQFLNELDGVETDNSGILILAATNAPWHLDPAFRRPGRFDRIIFVPPPDLPARAEIVNLLMRGKPVDGVDAQAIAKNTENFSGADLAGVVDRAIEEKLREAMKSGVPTPLRTKDLLAAAKIQKATTREWFSTAKNYALYANEGGQYDEIVNYMKSKRI